MFPRQLGYEFAILATFCALAIFFFPAASGPYSAVHGPVTALLSVRAKLKLCLGLVMAGSLLLGHILLAGFARLRTAGDNAIRLNSVPAEQISILRC